MRLVAGPERLSKNTNFESLRNIRNPKAEKVSNAAGQTLYEKTVDCGDKLLTIQLRKPFDVVADGDNLVIPAETIGRDLNDEFSRIMKRIPQDSMRISLDTKNLPPGTPYTPKNDPGTISGDPNAALASCISGGAPSAIPQVPDVPINDFEMNIGCGPVYKA